MSKDNNKKKKIIAGVAFALSFAATEAVSLSAAAEENISADYTPQDINVETVSTGEGLLGVAGQFSVFVKENFTALGADCPGSMAVGGDLNLPSDYVAGSAVIGGSIVSGSFQSDVPVTSAGMEEINFEYEFAKLTETSQKLLECGVNGNVYRHEYEVGKLVFEGSNTKLNVFTISADTYNELRSNMYGDTVFCFDVPEGSTVLVNIVGSGNIDLAVTGGATYAGQTVSNGTANNSKIIYNVVGAEEVVIGQSAGSLLATNSHVTSVDGGGFFHYEGQVICKSYEGYSEFGNVLFDGEDDIEDMLDENDETDFIDPEDPADPETPDNGEDTDPTDPETPETPDNGEDTDPETPDNGEDTDPETPDNGEDTDPVDPETPDNGEDTDPVDPETPDNGEDTDPTDPETPDNGEDTDPTDPETPDNGEDTDPTDPETPDNGEDTDPTDPETPDNGEDTDPTDPETPDNGEDTDPVDDIDDGTDPGFTEFDDPMTPLGSQPDFSIDDDPVPFDEFITPMGDTANSHTGVTSPAGLALAAAGAAGILMFASGKRRKDKDSKE